MLEGLRADMREAAANLEFQRAARLLDEIRHLKSVDLVFHDDPLARQQGVEKVVER